MTSYPNAVATPNTGKKITITLASIVAALFMLNLRDKLAADKTAGDNADAAYTWGL